MKKLALILAALILSAGVLNGCGKEEKKASAAAPGANAAPETAIADDILEGTQNEEDSYTETYGIIEDDAPVQTLDDITSFENIIDVYASCYNQTYMIEYDAENAVTDEKGTTYYAVTAPADTEEGVRGELGKYMSENAIRNEWKEELFFTSPEGKLYYSPADLGYTYDINEATLYRSVSDMCEVDITFNSPSGKSVIQSIEIIEGENGYIVDYVTHSEV